MTKSIKKIFLSLWMVLMLLSSSLAYGQDPPSSSGKSGNFSEKTFSDKNAWSTNQKGTLLPPDPGGGGTGTEMGTPIPKGLSILLLGSLIFFSVRVLNENKKRRIKG